ncbi:MAG: alpha/beta hydrolase [Pseudomonadales bacterium]|nr:alpha/beta hydrolase [Pseudomonadales bacterium]
MATGPASRNYFSQRLKLHYVEWGDKEAPVLLMVHGMRDHCRNWDWVAEDLSKDYRIIAPDLRGHGDSDWLVGGTYSMMDCVADLRQLINQTTHPKEKVAIMSHSFGGGVSLVYAGVFPEKVEKLMVIEGLGPPPAVLAEMTGTTIEGRITNWVNSLQSIAGRAHRKYESLEAAIARMHAENSHLTDQQARHLSIHGLNQNEDGTYSWKFDNYLRVMTPVQLTSTEIAELRARITCPVLLLTGKNSWAVPLENDERLKPFKNVETYTFEDAGHWCHHDQLAEYLTESRRFLGRKA